MNLISTDGCDVFQGFLSGSEGLEGSELDHLGEAFLGGNGFLNGLKFSCYLVEFLLLKQTITRGTLKQ